ncbi:tRNA (guanosine(37)-N1)-methyltransferase TrmD [Paenarthrobacter sp. Z7-10]|uniref:tRNA (guanosine(37)-N1)-methyltransferase TrmD n=1 Tax=Paenarthrobacter sp. Z7-10 TaxID=2787635 RepID=UPI0022A99FF6|nr:tRNA (guanosine(37)-N1)-methyltransferase TrmD [Paenarthrobacter sp. Z7-10]MCZ2403878.1 tRNA (guanosine(37)-N1)-methyltransferase TrmD [Paenarthrobacter sp. Z7-10]
MRFDVVSIFPEYLAPLELSLIGKARQDGILELNVHDLRDFATDRHRTVDDTPYGGGAGMVMKPEPWALALEPLAQASAADVPDPVNRTEAAALLDPEVRAEAGDRSGSDGQGSQAALVKPTLIVPSPAGDVFTQQLAQELSTEDRLVFACGRYEGIDERVLEWAADYFTVRPISLGDYVLNGGEVAVLAMVEAIGRLLPGVVGNPASLIEESHSDGLLEYPVYTKPSTWRERSIPDVLLSGNHAKIAQFRRDEQLRRTVARRPDLIAALDPALLTKTERATLAELGYAVVGGRLQRH